MTATKIVLNNRSFVIVPEADWIKVAGARSSPGAGPRTAGKRTSRTTAQQDDLPPLPPVDQRGNRPAVAFADASIARGIVRRRKRLGLSQSGLANLAGIRVDALNRAERALTSPSLQTLTRIERVLDHLERRARETAR